jgi:hypothetical protein
VGDAQNTLFSFSFLAANVRNPAFGFALCVVGCGLFYFAEKLSRPLPKFLQGRLPELTSVFVNKLAGVLFAVGGLRLLLGL